MGSKIKLWFINQKNLVKMSKFILLTVSLLLITWLFDHRYPVLRSYIPDQMLLSVDVSVNFLSNISGVFLTISIFSFTTIVTVLNKYSSSITPRMVQSFIDKTDVLGLYGIFVSGFFYSVISIVMLQGLSSDQHVVTGSFGIAYAIIAMIAFVVFSKQVLDNLKISNIIESVYNDCDPLIDRAVELRKKAKRYEDDQPATELTILAGETGYLFEIKADEILSDLEGIKTELTITKRIGEYATAEEALGLLRIFGQETMADEEKEALQKQISSALVINMYKNNEDDYHHELIKLTEIACMALSPGTNDPNTAVVCIDKISSLLGKLLSTDHQFIVLRETEDTKIIYQNYSVENELYLVFSQIVTYSAGDPLVSKAILQGLYMIYMLAGMSAKAAVKKYFDSSYDLITANFNHPVHLDRFEQIRKNIEEHISLKDEHVLA